MVTSTGDCSSVGFRISRKVGRSPREGGFARRQCAEPAKDLLFDGVRGDRRRIGVQITIDEAERGRQLAVEVRTKGRIGHVGGEQLQLAGDLIAHRASAQHECGGLDAQPELPFGARERGADLFVVELAQAALREHRHSEFRRRPVRCGEPGFPAAEADAHLGVARLEIGMLEIEDRPVAEVQPHEVR